MNLLCHNRMQLNPFQRRHLGLFGVCWTLTSSIMIIAKHAFEHHPTGAAAYGFALLPAIPFLCMIIVAGRYLSLETDEFIRMIFAQAMLWGIGVTLAVDTTWGFLSELAGVHALPQFLNYILFFTSAAFAAAILRRKYR